MEMWLQHSIQPQTKIEGNFRRVRIQNTHIDLLPLSSGNNFYTVTTPIIL